MRIITVEKEEEVDEKIGSYFECISVIDRKRWVAEELHNSRDLGITTMGQWTMEKLRTSVGGWKVLKNAPNYEILTNTKFQQAF